jgi:glycerophosphoryl diester phosphodiesterase
VTAIGPLDASLLLQPCWAGRTRTIACHRADLDAMQVPNSLPAVLAAVAALAPRIEIDLRFLADDAMVVFHDPDLAPLTGAQGLLDDLSFDVVSGARYVAGDSPPVARFEDVVDAIAGSSTFLHVDLKHAPPMNPARLDALSAALRPIAGQCLVGTQAHWNLPPLARRGLQVALDPGLHIQRGLDRQPGDGEWPVTRGGHGLWDDSPLAHLAGVAPADYLAARVNDLAGLVPEACEWMVDIDTIRHSASLGFSLAEAVHARGIALTAWTIADLDFDREGSAAMLAELFNLDVDTVIAKHGLIVAGYLAG